MYSMHRPSHPNVACYNIPGNGTSAGRVSPRKEQFSNLSRRRMSGERGCGASFPRGRAFCRFLFICFFAGLRTPCRCRTSSAKKEKEKDRACYPSQHEVISLFFTASKASEQDRRQVASTAKACCRALCSLFVWRTWGTFEADFHGYGWYRRRHVEALKHDRGIHREESTQSTDRVWRR